ncbi:LytR/AlgR family response regulator transcription factor [Pedobacter steynii]|uniref:DNA-binding response regulator n=1 Tax=Pedobacter steynii TaxID=430522 RepID=A0A1D7QMT7_9SPHI|nr:LytTR family DNA-binding domain-containing protein [Pedobacter steynii]AOM79973.1 DNA-binding response regulator [Pedobacter steynii]
MTILVVEDEGRIAGRIERMSRNFFGIKLQKIHICESIEEALSFLEKNDIEVLLLDLNLNGRDGFELLKSMVSKSFHTIIISAYTEKAITAFEYGVLDFVAKPFDEGRLSQAFQRISAAQNQGESGLRFLAVKRSGNIVLIDVNELLYIKGAGIYTELHLKNGRQELHDKSLEKLEQLLPATFERIHKSYIVPITPAMKITVSPGSKYHLLLENGETLPIGRTRYADLKERLFH